MIAEFQPMKRSEKGIDQSINAATSNSGTFVQAHNILPSLLGVQVGVQVILDSIEIRKGSGGSVKIMFK